MNQPAFPVNPDVLINDDTLWQGMTLRDYFAAKAMQALIQVYEKDSRDGFVYDCVDSAYFFADVMLEERKT